MTELLAAAGEVPPDLVAQDVDVVGVHEAQQRIRRLVTLDPLVPEHLLQTCRGVHASALLLPVPQPVVRSRCAEGEALLAAGQLPLRRSACADVTQRHDTGVGSAPAPRGDVQLDHDRAPIGAGHVDLGEAAAADQRQPEREVEQLPLRTAQNLGRRGVGEADQVGVVHHEDAVRGGAHDLQEIVVSGLLGC